MQVWFQKGKNEGYVVLTKAQTNKSAYFEKVNPNAYVYDITFLRNFKQNFYSVKDWAVQNHEMKTYKSGKIKANYIQMQGSYKDSKRKTNYFIERHYAFGKTHFQLVISQNKQFKNITSADTILNKFQPKLSNVRLPASAATTEGDVCIDCIIESLKEGNQTEAAAVAQDISQAAQKKICENIDPSKLDPIMVSWGVSKKDYDSITSTVIGGAANCIEGFSQTLTDLALMVVDLRTSLKEGIVDGKYSESLGNVLERYAEENKDELEKKPGFFRALGGVTVDGLSNAGRTFFWNPIERFSARWKENSKKTEEFYSKTPPPTAGSTETKVDANYAHLISTSDPFSYSASMVNALKNGWDSATAAVSPGVALVMNYVNKEVGEYHCLNNAEKSEYICRVIGHIAGDGAAAIKAGLKLGSKVIAKKAIKTEAELTAALKEASEAAMEAARKPSTAAAKAGVRTEAELTAVLKEASEAAMETARKSSAAAAPKAAALRSELKLKGDIEWDGWNKPELHYLYHKVSPKDYTAFKEVSLEVMDIIGSDPVIGLGRSPAPITAMLSGFKKADTKNIALSDFRSNPLPQGSLPEHYTKVSNKFNPLSEKDQTALFEYFDKQLSDHLRSKKGDVYILDVGESGASLFAFTKYLEIYAKQRNIPVNLKTIVITNPKFASNVEEMAKFYGIKPKVLTYGENKFVEDTFKSSAWDYAAEYGNYNFQDIQRTGSTWVVDRFTGNVVDFDKSARNSGYDSFRTSIYINMLQDNKIHLKDVSFLPEITTGLEDVNWDVKTRSFRSSKFPGKEIKISTGSD